MWSRMQEGMLQMLVPARKPRTDPEPDEPPGPPEGAGS
jgi:hypothetical protein